MSSTQPEPRSAGAALPSPHNRGRGVKAQPHPPLSPPAAPPRPTAASQPQAGPGGSFGARQPAGRSPPGRPRLPPAAQPGAALPEALRENGGLSGGGGGERGGWGGGGGGADELRSPDGQSGATSASGGGRRGDAAGSGAGGGLRAGAGRGGAGWWLRARDVRFGGEAAQRAAQRSAALARCALRLRGQQSVTGVSAADDGNSYWRVRGRTAAVCERGQPVRCGQAIRLTHLGTGRNLHSHHFVSPLSGNQEVSAFGEDGEGDYLDDWTVLCSGTYWARDSEVRFQHASTDVFLSVTGEQYGRPINGQREVHGMATSSQNNYWKVMEGIFMQPGEMFKAEQHHVEL
ncbi:stromal cell-derived factor 2 isoform X1 [Gallus gallus]|uniref:stromal cell-derived factor 2 isoform X1 n=1 Tax=Gallus gallus TaxID=9031 RepID=UPI001F005A93|nr:stromal cell-derived factor 2 isoform X1 [Gallus gallus]XP_046786332.1 stromal cell-derived factor 2 isoform X1 [Gallus gallus]